MDFPTTHARDMCHEIHACPCGVHVSHLLLVCMCTAKRAFHQQAASDVCMHKSKQRKRTSFIHALCVCAIFASPQCELFFWMRALLFLSFFFCGAHATRMCGATDSSDSRLSATKLKTSRVKPPTSIAQCTHNPLSHAPSFFFMLHCHKQSYPLGGEKKER